MSTDKTKLPTGFRLPMPPPAKAFSDKKNEYKRKDKHKKKIHERLSFVDFYYSQD